MRDRVGALDGRVSIVTAVGQGTVVSGSIPLRRDEHIQPPLTPEPTPADRSRGHVTPA
jgi:hypothetical protein